MTKISRTTDMTQGSEMRHIIMFSLPLLAGNLLQQTYNIVDTMVVGRYLGDDALAAVGATGSITYLFYTLCIGLSVGAGIIAAQYFGAGRQKALRSAVFNSALVTAIFGIVISLLSVPAAKPILELLKVPDKLMGDSVAYMQIACGSPQVGQWVFTPSSRRSSIGSFLAVQFTRWLNFSNLSAKPSENLAIGNSLPDLSFIISLAEFA